MNRKRLVPVGRYSAFWLILLLPTFCVNRGEGFQTSTRPISPQEYIQSVTPLATGGSAMNRAAPGSNVQDVYMIAQLPSSSAANPVVGYQPRSYQGQWSNLPSTVANTTPTTAGDYLYPTQAPSGSGYQRPTNTLGLEPIGNRSYQPTGFFQRSAPATQVAQDCPTCSGGTTTNYPIPSTTLPTYNPPPQTGTSASPPALPTFNPPPPTVTTTNPPATIGVPSLTAPAPVFANDGNWQGMHYDPNLGFNSPSTYNPGRINYTPLFALRNLPPGTYIGQGILGQPKAYIDGEPIRNLLRYLSY